MSADIPGRATSPVHYGVSAWIEENEKFFLPPVCNKMMHNTQLKVEEYCSFKVYTKYFVPLEHLN